MGTKKFQISVDAGVTLYTFPGDTADLQNQATGIKDTVFGQDFESEQTGMINWTMSANGFYKGFAGYVAKINKGGTPTSMADEATTQIGSSKSYQITNAAHRWLDLATAVTVKDGVTDQTANLLSVDYMNGIVTFKSSYTPAGAITVSGDYLPMTQIAKGQSFTLTQTAATKKTTDFNTAQTNNGVDTFDYALRTVSLDLGGIYAISNAWLAALTSRSNLYIEINPDGSSLSAARGIFKPMTQGQSGKVAELEAEALKFSLFVPDPATYPLLVAPFAWNHAAGTTLSMAIQKALTAWVDGTLPTFNYLYDGTNGQTGTGVITEISLTGGLDVMNTFALKVQGSDALTAVGTG